MSDYPRKPTGHECPPLPENPADQPHPPGDKCGDLPTTTPPVLDPPEKCPDPVPPCNCPKPPGSNSNCLESLIEKQAEQITVAEGAKAFKTDLEALLAKAKVAAQEYTRDKYDKLVKQWQDQDREIAELIRKLVCAVPCWRCIIECYVCPLINDLHDNEKWLYGDGTFCPDVHNLYDLRYWLDRDREAKKLIFQRIKNVLAAWEKPAQTIEKTLADDAKRIADAGKALGTDAPKVVYDVFFWLVPMHLAIAPPATDPDLTTKIGKEFTQFCDCDKGTPDNCCGPDVGKLSWRQNLIGPQPYLVDPNDYFNIICCLVENRYRPAKDAVAAAEAAFQTRDNEIKRRQAKIDNALKTFDKDAKGAIPSVVDCCDFEPDETEPKATAQR
jgi:hypothetical protein